MKNIQKIFISIAGVVILILVVVVSVISLGVFRQIEESAAIRKHNFIVINDTADLLSELKDAETGERGFLLTNNKAYLEPYLAVIGIIPEHVAELRRLILISAAKKHLDAAVPLIDAKMAELAQVIVMRRNNDTASALELIESGKGKLLMDSIRVEMKDLNQIEQDALAKSDSELQKGLHFLFFLIITASLFMLLSALSLVYFIYREKQQQIKEIIHAQTQHLLVIQEETNKQLKQVNTTLQISEEKYAVTLGSIGDAVLATDGQGHVTYLNAVAEQLTGWTIALASGRPADEIFRIINEETRQPSISPIKETLAHGTIQSLANHTILIARSGSECAIADSCAPIHNREGQVLGAVLVFRDVTERMKIDKCLKKACEDLNIQSIELKRAAQAKSDFLGNMSHELRTPLNSINGFSEVLYDETFGPLNNKQKIYINNILTSGQHLLLLINQILDLSKVESGKMNLSLSSLPMKNLLNDISLLLADTVNKKNLKMQLEIDVNLPDIEADELKVKEIVYNLLSNAVKFTPEGGKIGMRAEKTGSEIEVTVWDTGVGIAVENMEKIFEGFFRVDTPFSRVTEGTGLGLPLSKKLVELHGGKLFVESMGLNKGTSVKFTLPVISAGVVLNETKNIGS
jgi:two-component system CheB/CheR fusion protein